MLTKNNNHSSNERVTSHKDFFLQLYRLLVGNFNQRNTFTRGVQKGVMKDRDRIINQYYLSINDIKTLLGVSQSTAKKVFDKADELDDKKFKEFRVETKKVTIKSVLEINHLKLKDLKKEGC